MDFEITDHQRLKAIYLCFAYLYLIPRLLLFPFVYCKYYLRTALLALPLFGANYFVLASAFPGGWISTLYGAFIAPLMSIWLSLLNFRFQQDNPNYYYRDELD